MEIEKIIKDLSRIESRIGAKESEARDLLCKLLETHNITYKTQVFESSTPNFIKFSLTADGDNIECLPCGLKSGEIVNSYNLISSLTSSQKFIDTPNINFNPKSDAICLCNFYFAPALAVSRLDVPRIMSAKVIKGVVEVTPKKYQATNILVGNSKNPKTIIFAHYDAYFSGATDNASGVAVCIKTLLTNKSLLVSTLLVLAGNEELSYDYPIYWGRCFRQFQKQNGQLIKNAKKIIVVDSVGDGPPVSETDPYLLKLAFPIDSDKDILSKSLVLTGDFEALMSVYHSSLDLQPRLNRSYLNDTVNFLANLL